VFQPSTVKNDATMTDFLCAQTFRRWQPLPFNNNQLNSETMLNFDVEFDIGYVSTS
jgi:hypothetical protein